MIGYRAKADISGVLYDDPIEKPSKNGEKIFCAFKVIVKNRFKDSTEDNVSIFPVFSFDDDISKLILLNLKKGDPISFTSTISYKKNPKSGNMTFSLLISSSDIFTPIVELKKRAAEYVKGLGDIPNIQDDDIPW